MSSYDHSLYLVYFSDGSQTHLLAKDAVQAESLARSVHDKEVVECVFIDRPGP